MTPSELVAATEPLDGPLGPVTHIYLTLPRARLPKGDRVRLAGRSGPLGRTCNVREDGNGGFRVVACFDRNEVNEFARRMAR